MFCTRDAWCVFVFMIQMIYSQQNISQLGVCPLSLDKYLPEATRGPWTRCSVQSVLCVCVCGLFRSRLFPSEPSHLEWTCFRNRTASYYLLFSDITRVLWQIHVSHFSTISVTRSKKKKWNYANADLLLLVQMKNGKLTCYVSLMRPKRTFSSIVDAGEHAQGYTQIWR